MKKNFLISDAILFVLFTIGVVLLLSDSSSLFIFIGTKVVSFVFFYAFAAYFQYCIKKCIIEIPEE